MKILLHNIVYHQNLHYIAGHGETIQCKEFTLIMQKSKVTKWWWWLLYIQEAIPLKIATAATTIEALRKFFSGRLSHVSKDWKCPIAFVSRTLTKAECNYEQNEKGSLWEPLALVYGVKIS